MAVRMEVVGLAVDPISKVPIVVLREQGGDRAFPIWIGPAEASAIATRLEGIEVPRPLTHDLLAAVLAQLGGVVTEIEVTELKGTTFFAVIRVERGGDRLVIDSRPSDAIALALRVGAPILADEAVLAQAQKVRIRSVTGAEGATGRGLGDAESPIVGDGAPPPGEGQGAWEPGRGPRFLDPNTPADQWTEVLEGLTPEDFGKYKM